MMTVTPGPNNLLLMSSGLSFGLYRTGWHVAGILSGVLLLIVLTGAGIGAVFALFPGFQIVLKAVGSAYMLGYEYGDTDLIYMPGAGSAYFHDTAGASP